MSLTPLDKLDEARILARDLQAQLEAAKALLQARECGREERLPNSPALELSSREAYGFGLMLGLLADRSVPEFHTTVCCRCGTVHIFRNFLPQ